MPHVRRPDYAASLSLLNFFNKNVIRPDGVFGYGNVSGAFYGPGGGKAAGTFNYRGSNGCHGAFGVRKPK